MNLLFKRGFTFVFIVITLFFIGYVCQFYKHTFAKLSSDAKLNILKKPSALYLLSPFFFWIASRTFLFKNANGPLMNSVNSLFKNLNEPNTFKKLVPFTSLLAVVASSLILHIWSHNCIQISAVFCCFSIRKVITRKF